MNEGAAGRRIGWFAIGAALVVLSGFVAWGAFALLTMMMDPMLEGNAYWTAIRNRMSANPGLSAVLVLSCVGALGGVVLMGRAAWGRMTGAEGSSAVGPEPDSAA